LPAAVITADIRRLESIAEDLRPIIDKTIAHRERKYKKLKKVTWSRIHASVSEIEEICKRYSLILNQVTMISLLPSITAANASAEAIQLWEGRLRDAVHQKTLRQTFK